MIVTGEGSWSRPGEQLRRIVPPPTKSSVRPVLLTVKTSWVSRADCIVRGRDLSLGDPIATLTFATDLKKFETSVRTS
jgi:hypothetical protein